MANTVAALIRTSSRFGLQIIINHSKSTLLKSQAVRTLYSHNTLGLDGYVQQRERTISQLSNIVPKFREKMEECTNDDSRNMVFTEDLKNMLHLAENDEDVELIIKMLKKFNKQNKQLRFGNYIFGPVIMRMFYHLNKPTEALESFKSPELDGLFDQIITYQLLLDLLYEHQRYSDILDTFKVIQDRQIEGIRYPKNVVVLVLAACYKMNTAESLEFALKIWSELQEVGHLPMRRATTFCTALALNQGKPDIALEILASARNVNYTTVRNLKVSSLIDLGRTEEAISVLKGILLDDRPDDGKKQTFNKDVVEKVKAAVGKENIVPLKVEFERIEKEFKDNNHISDLLLDQQLCEQIASPPRLGKTSRDGQSQFRQQNFQHRVSFNRDNNYNRDRPVYDRNRPGYNKDGPVNRAVRPGLTDLM